MIHAPLSTTSVLDEATDIVSMVASPWAAVVIATSIPYRFLQALFIDRLIEVGGDATHYGTLLGTTANLAIAAFVLALWGRAVFARACRLAASRGEPPAAEAWKVSPVALTSYIFTGTLAAIVEHELDSTFGWRPNDVFFWGPHAMADNNANQDSCQGDALTLHLTSN